MSGCVQIAGPPKVHPKYRARATALVLQEEISTGTVHTQFNIVHSMGVISKNAPQGSMGLVHIKSNQNTVSVPHH